MKSYLTDKKANLLILGCWLIYVAAYCGRLNYSASLTAIISDLGITNAQGGMVYSAFAITYGVGQFANGLLCKFYNPKYVLTAALAASGVCNLLLPFCSDPLLMAGIWLVNGAVQSMLWSLIIRTLSTEVADNKLDSAIVALSSTVAVGTALAFGISALFAALGNWRITFFTSSAVLFVMAAVWFCIACVLSRAERVEAAPVTAVPLQETPKAPPSATPLQATLMKGLMISICAICAAAIVNGFIKDGVNNWLPKYLTERFSLPTSLSIILTLLLPLFSILGTVIGRLLYRKLHNHTLICSLEYGISCLLLCGILLSHTAGALIPMMILFILLACMMASVNNIITSMFPLDNRHRINSGLLAGTLDTVCYVGSSIAGTLLGLLAQNRGWMTVFTLLLVLSAVAALVCLVFSLPVRKSRSKRA